MIIRPYTSSDCKPLADLFYATVHAVNAQDYTPAQLDAWASGQVDLAQWDRSFLAHHTLVALEDGRIVGFGDMDNTGYLDRLFVHRDYQRRGVASALCAALEQAVPGEIRTAASITAKPFFRGRGYRVVREQQVARGGVLLTNYWMIKPAGRPEL